MVQPLAPGAASEPRVGAEAAAGCAAPAAAELVKNDASQERRAASRPDSCRRARSLPALASPVYVDAWPATRAALTRCDHAAARAIGQPGVTVGQLLSDGARSRLLSLPDADAVLLLAQLSAWNAQQPIFPGGGVPAVSQRLVHLLDHPRGEAAATSATAPSAEGSDIATHGQRAVANMAPPPSAQHAAAPIARPRFARPSSKACRSASTGALGDHSRDLAADPHAERPAMSASVAGVRSQADGDDTDTAAALVANGTSNSDDPKPPHDCAAAQDAAPPSPGMLVSVAGVRSQADGDDTYMAAAPIADDTTKSDDLQALAAQSAHDDAASTYALGDAVMVVAGGGRRSHEGIVRFVGATRFAPRVWGWRVAL